MILNSQQNEVARGGVQEEGNFTISINAKAFKVLSDTLYTDKIGSIVRELSCNALDSHIMTPGKSDVPFEIHLPDTFEPWFAVKDFGLGMSKNSIFNVCTAFFVSTKDQSNEAIGSFGLGFKSPMSYTDQFTITSNFEGIQYIYSAFLDNGIPKVALLAEIPTDESNGVEIKMAVEGKDFYKFNDAVARQLQFFSVKPTILNGTVYFPTNLMNEIFLQTEGAVIGSGGRQSYVVQGPVGYEFKVSDFAETYGSDKVKTMVRLFAHDMHIILNFKIGEIQVTPSREALSFDPTTIKNVSNKIEELYDIFTKTFESKMSEFATEWERAVCLNNNRLFRKFAAYYADINKFLPNGVIDTEYTFSRLLAPPQIYFKLHHTVTVTSSKSTMDDKGDVTQTQFTMDAPLDLRYYAMSNSGNRLMCTDHDRANIAAENSTVVIVRDTEEKPTIRLRNFAKTNCREFYVICAPRNVDYHLTDADIQAVSDKLGGHKVIRLSTLVIPPIIRKESKSRGPNMTGMHVTRSGMHKFYLDFNEDIEEDSLYLLVEDYSQLNIDCDESRAISEYRTNLSCGLITKPLYVLKPRRFKNIEDKSFFESVIDVNKKIADSVHSNTALVDYLKYKHLSNLINDRFPEAKTLIKFVSAGFVKTNVSDPDKLIFKNLRSYIVLNKKIERITRKFGNKIDELISRKNLVNLLNVNYDNVTNDYVSILNDIEQVKRSLVLLGPFYVQHTSTSETCKHILKYIDVFT